MSYRRSRAELLKIFKNAGAILKGHFVYTSGDHGKVYVNKDAVYPHPQIHELCLELAMRLPFRIVDECQAVVAPALGGIVLSRLVADYLRQCHDTEFLAVYAEKTADGKKFDFTRGYDKLIAKKSILIVDDIMTKGKSVAKVKAAAEKCGARVIGVAVLWNRGGITNDILQVSHLTSLINHQFPSWNEADCPLCKQGVPVNQEVGKGREFVIRTQIVEPIEGVAKKLGLKVAAVIGGGKKK